jgi:hypothetical protein
MEKLMSIIDDVIDRFSNLIDKPIAKNKKQGFVLKNGMRILLDNSYLSTKSQEILKRHYEKERNKK